MEQFPTSELPSVEDLIGPEPKELPAVEDLIGKPPVASSVGAVDDLGRPYPSGPLSGAGMDAYFTHSAPGRILSAIGQGVSQGWGDGPVGFSPETEAAMRKAGIFVDQNKTRFDIVKAANEAFLRPAAMAIDGAIRAGSAALGGVTSGAAQLGTEAVSPEFGRAVGGVLESAAADMGSGIHPEVPNPTRADVLAHEVLSGLSDEPVVPRQAALEPIAQTEAQFKGLEPTPPNEYSLKGEAQAAPQPQTYQMVEPHPAPDGSGSLTNLSDADFYRFKAEQAGQPDVHGIARAIAPDTFNEYDALAARKDDLRAQIEQAQTEARQAAEAAAPHAAEIADLEQRMQDTTPRLAKKYQARLDAMVPERDAYLEGVTNEDTPEIAQMRQDLLAADYRMRDLAPDVTAAYAKAAEMSPKVEEPARAEPVPAAPEALSVAAAPSAPEQNHVRLYHGGSDPTSGGPRWVTPDLAYARRYADKSRSQVHFVDLARDHPDVQAATDFDAVEGTNMKAPIRHFEASEAVAKQLRPLDPTQVKPTVEPAAPKPEAPRVAPIASIADDVAGKLVKAGRPTEEAAAAGKVTEALWQTRAAAFGGAKGTAEEMYAREAPDIRAGKAQARVRQPEMAQKGVTGKINLADDGRAMITLMGHADASTFMHEVAHDWVERMMRDAADPAAPQTMLDDAAAVRAYLGVKDGWDGTRIDRNGRKVADTGPHEKFARSFERYLMEGRAPTQALADVFAKFKAWLTSIYQTVTKLRAPITDDIRNVFDRMLSADPEARTAIVPERAQDVATPRSDAAAQRAAVGVTSDLADLHEADAASTQPPDAAPAAERVEAERTETARTHADEVDRAAGYSGAPPEEAGESPSGREGVSGGGERPAADTGEPDNSGQSGEVGASGGNAAADGNRSSPSTETPAGPSQPFGHTDDLVDKAGNIRLDNLNRPDDVLQAIRDAAEQNNDFLTARRGVVSDAEVSDLADALGMRAEDLAKRQIGQAFNAEQVTAARRLLVESATRVRDAMLKAAEGSDADVLAYGEAKARHQMIQEQVSGITAEAGRALRAFRMMGGEADIGAVNQFIQNATGRTLNQMRREAELGSKLTTSGQVSKFVHGTASPTLWQRVRPGIISWFVNALISGPLTHAAYSVGNVVTNVAKSLVYIPAEAALDTIRGAGADRVYLGEAGAHFYGAIKGLSDGLVPGWEAAKTGVPFMMGESAGQGALAIMGDTYKPQTIPGIVGKIIEAPGRMVSAIHTVAYSMNYEAEIARRAYRQAVAEGLDGMAFNARVADLSQNPHPAMMNAAHDEALNMVLMGRPKYGSFQQKVVDAVNSNIVAKIAMPFMQIGTNIIKQGLFAHTPLAFADETMRDNLMGRNGDLARTTQLAKLTVGTGVVAAVMAAQGEGIITGGGSSDPRERQIEKLAGFSPYSVRIGDTYVPIKKYLGPLGLLVGAAADMAHAGHLLAEGEQMKAASALVFGVSEAVMNESWMAGLANLMGAIKDYDKADGERYLQQLAASFVPYSSALNQATKLIDPYARVAQTTSEALQSKNPFFSQGLLPRRDIFGRPMANTMMLSPTQINSDPVVVTMQALEDRGERVFPAKLRQDMRGVKLDEAQYDQYSAMSGMLLKQHLDALINQPGFTSMPDVAQKDAIVKTTTMSRASAEKIFLTQDLAARGDQSVAMQAARNQAIIRTTGIKPK